MTESIDSIRRRLEMAYPSTAREALDIVQRASYQLVVTEEMVSAAARILYDETSPPYYADDRLFTDKQVAAGELKKADDEAEAMNRALVRRMLEVVIKPIE